MKNAMRETGKLLIMQGKQVTISGPNVVQILILFVIALCAGFILIHPDGRNVLNVLYGITLIIKVSFGILVIIGTYEIREGEGSWLELLSYLIMGSVWSSPMFYLSLWREGLVMLIAYAIIMIIWNGAGGLKGIWTLVKTKIQSIPTHVIVPSVRLPNLRRLLGRSGRKDTTAA
jgi:hypothetical protein